MVHQSCMPQSTQNEDAPGTSMDAKPLLWPIPRTSSYGTNCRSSRCAPGKRWFRYGACALVLSASFQIYDTGGERSLTQRCEAAMSREGRSGSMRRARVRARHHLHVWSVAHGEEAALRNVQRGCRCRAIVRVDVLEGAHVPDLDGRVHACRDHVAARPWARRAQEVSGHA